MAAEDPVSAFFQIAPVKKFETYGNKSIPVYDFSGVIVESPAITYPGLKTIRADQLFTPGSVFFGFGLPNVYTAHCYGPEDCRIVAAKSLYRAEMCVRQTKGRVQSGVFFVPLNLPEEIINKVQERALSREGEKNVTCVAENLGILASAGFQLDGSNILDYRLPHGLFNDIVLGKKVFVGSHEVAYAIVKTTPLSLEEYFDRIQNATRTTPIRHLNRAWDTEEAKEERKKIATDISKENERRLQQLSQGSFEAQKGESTFTVQVSETGTLGYYFRALWGSHVIYKLQLHKHPKHDLINELLPDTLKEFSMPDPSLFTKVKQHYLFSKSVVDMVRDLMASGFDEHTGFTQHNIHAMLQPEVDGDQRRYNLVVTSREMILVSNSVYFGFVDWVLSKHVLISGYSPDVRFAGEIWKTEDGKIHVNNNSGTYRPTNEQVQNAVKLANVFFPALEVVAEYAEAEGGEASVAPPVEKGEIETNDEFPDTHYRDYLWDDFPQSNTLEENIDELRGRLDICTDMQPLRVSTLGESSLGESLRMSLNDFGEGEDDGGDFDGHLRASFMS
mmetsp:Transcript_15654/g.44404  ORF Transcript_15654/g.44404 Transcript_15654/m.44404 type:complete len:560 (+) Transcript_15654:79-1758(+)